MKRALLLATLATLTAACGGEDDTPAPLQLGGSGGTGSAGLAGSGGLAGSALGGSGGSVGVQNPPGRSRCTAPAGTSSSPQTIEEAVALLNALPKPTSVACFVESLARPLHIYASDSMFSAQPAFSTRSPRVFIKTGTLWSSIVMDGDASELIEFGHLIPGTMRSIKGEVHLPLEAPLAPTTPYERVLFGDAGTACGLCHTNEEPMAIPGVGMAFASTAFKPRDDTHVRISNLRLEAATCNWQREPIRCELYSALFGGGDVVEELFPESMLTFF